MIEFEEWRYRKQLHYNFLKADNLFTYSIYLFIYLLTEI